MDEFVDIFVIEFSCSFSALHRETLGDYERASTLSFREGRPFDYQLVFFHEDQTVRDAASDVFWIAREMATDRQNPATWNFQAALHEAIEEAEALDRDDPETGRQSRVSRISKAGAQMRDLGYLHGPYEEPPIHLAELRSR